LGLPLLSAPALAPEPAAAQYVYRPEVDPIPQEFLAGVRSMSVQAAVFLWHDGGWVALGRSTFVEAWIGLLRHEVGHAAWQRASDAAARSLREARPLAGRPVEPPVVLESARPPAVRAPDDWKARLSLRVFLRVRDGTGSLPAAERAAGARLFAAVDSVRFSRASLTGAPYWGMWPLVPGLVVGIAPAAEVEERVLARLETVVENTIAAVRDRFV
jgi:hypothetical protein